MELLSGNKGEWSEVYVLLKLLGDGKIYAADADLNTIDNVFYNIIKILRKEKVEIIEYYLRDETSTVDVVKQGNTLSVTLPTDEFKMQAAYLLQQLKKQKAASFSFPEIQKFLERISVGKLRADSLDKSDIKIKIYDYNTGLEPELGFSIKSRIGNPSTLLNAGKTTNFTYRIEGNITDSDMEEFNGDSSGFKKKMDKLLRKGCKINCLQADNEIFRNNLILVDSKLPEIIGYLLLEFYVYGNNTIEKCVSALSIKNPLQYDLIFEHNFYEYKMKKLLSEVALGMMPSKIWDGLSDATGGYIIVREDGEVLCYHLYNRNEFEDYLIKNTKMEKGSTTKHGFLKIYKENDEYRIKLNLQIRFTK